MLGFIANYAMQFLNKRAVEIYQNIQTSEY